MAFDHAKFLARFVDEAREHCSRIAEGLLVLEKGPADAETVHAVFRGTHTIKGTARMMKLPEISELAHGMEDMLDAARNGRITLTRERLDLLFQGLDRLSAMLDQVAGGGRPAGAAPLAAILKQAATDAPSAPDAPSGAPPAPEGPAAPPAGPAEAAPAPETRDPAGPETTPASGAGPAQRAHYLKVNAAKLDDLVRLMGEVLAEHGRVRHAAQWLRGIERQSRLQAPAAPGEAAGLAASLRQAATALRDAVAMQDHLMAELQDASLKLRMLPLATVFDPLRRTVRDLSREFGKDIEFTVQGGETELDRKIAERIGDSLLHLIRNALDHGMESAEERLAAGKPAQGRITLTAFYDSGGVTIALRDDGRGLCTEKIRAKALARRLFDAEALARLSRAEVHNLIFLPGFSTSPIITDISGRGVGMDVVRKSIVDELKGTILIDTEEGRGTSFLLRLPLNLAVFPLFLVRSRERVWALPAASIVEMHTVDQSEIIDIIDKRAIRLREQIVPVEDLGAILWRDRPAAPSQGKATVVVVRDGENKLGLLVDAIVDREEMVVKPLPAHLKNLRLVTGATVSEAGAVVAVLHAPELMRLARDTADRGRAVQGTGEEQGARILVVDDSVNTREIEKSILEAYGYLVDTAEDGQEALEKARETPFDLVVTDVEMPRMDGFTLTERLRADPRLRSVPVVIVTSLEQEQDKKRGIAVGADAYIVKRAFDQSNLLDTVKSLIG